MSTGQRHPLGVGLHEREPRTESALQVRGRWLAVPAFRSMATDLAPARTSHAET